MKQYLIENTDRILKPPTETTYENSTTVTTTTIVENANGTVTTTNSTEVIGSNATDARNTTASTNTTQIKTPSSNGAGISGKLTLGNFTVEANATIPVNKPPVIDTNVLGKLKISS